MWVDSNVVYLYSHLIRAEKFSMPPNAYLVSGNDALFKLPNDVVVGIQSTIITLNNEVKFMFD